MDSAKRRWRSLYCVLDFARGRILAEQTSGVKDLCLAVLVVCGLEFFQLYNPEPLATFRRTRFGAALLGSTFVWADIPPYFIGGVIGWLILMVVGSRRY